jgi:hypothetical protein
MWIRVSSPEPHTVHWVNLDKAAIIIIDEANSTACIDVGGTEYTATGRADVEQIQAWLGEKIAVGREKFEMQSQVEALRRKLRPTP